MIRWWDQPKYQICKMMLVGLQIPHLSAVLGEKKFRFKLVGQQNLVTTVELKDKQHWLTDQLIWSHHSLFYWSVLIRLPFFLPLFSVIHQLVKLAL